MTEKQLTAADVAEMLMRLSTEIASTAYKRRHPSATDEEVLAWAMKHRILFVTEALDVLVMVGLTEAEKEDYRQGQGPDHGEAP